MPIEVEILTDYIEKGYLYSPIVLIPSDKSKKRTYINQDGIKFLEQLQGATGEIHPLSDFGLAICQFLTNEQVLQEHKTPFGLKFAFVSEEGPIIVQKLIEEIKSKLP